MKRFANIWFLWLFLTIIYLILYWAGFYFRAGEIFARIIGLIGLFVPFGFWSASEVLMRLTEGNLLWGMLPLVLFVSSAIFISKIKFSARKKILMNLALLFVLTLIIDLILWQSWLSLGILITGNPTSWIKM